MLKVAILNVNEDLVVKKIETNLESLQEIVGGLIEYVYINDTLSVVINEEGKLMQLEPQLKFGRYDYLCGNIIFIRVNDELQNEDLTDEDISYIQEYISENKLSDIEVEWAKSRIKAYFS